VERGHGRQRKITRGRQAAQSTLEKGDGRVSGGEGEAHAPPGSRGEEGALVALMVKWGIVMQHALLSGRWRKERRRVKTRVRGGRRSLGGHISWLEGGGGRL